MTHRHDRRAEAAAVARRRLDRPTAPVLPRGTAGGTDGSAYEPSARAAGARTAAALRRNLRSLDPNRTPVVLWRVAAVASLAASSVSAALLSSSLAAADTGVPSAALATDAAILCAAGLVVALTARRAARLATATITVLQLIAVSAARHANGWPAEHGSQSADTMRLLCAGAFAALALALLSWLDNGTRDAP